MDIAAIISRNLTALMASYPDRETLEKVAHVAHVGFSTVRRAKNGDGNLTVQNLELIARAFRRTAKDLLAEPIDQYGPTAPVTVLAVHEPPVEERELLQGYRDASQEVREILLDLARKATRKKDFGPRSESNDWPELDCARSRAANATNHDMVSLWIPKDSRRAGLGWRPSRISW